MISLNEFTNHAVTLVLGIVVGVVGCNSYYTHQKLKLLTQVSKQHEIDSKVISSYLTNQQTLQQSYIDLGKKVHEQKLTTAPCYLTNDAVRLWNKSSSPSEGLPASTRGVVSDSSSSGVTVEDAIANKVVNDNGCTQMREELTAIKQWKKETYGE
jgi:hypothetical protein